MNDIKETTQTISLSSGIEEGLCSICGFKFNDYYGLSGKINHYIEKHNYTLLHIGQETTIDDKGNLWQNTIAILGN